MRHADVLGPARRCPDDGRGDATRTVLGDDDPRCANGAGRPKNRADILGILKVVQHQDERILVGLNIRKKFLKPDIGIARRLQGNTLMVSEARQPIQLVAVHRTHDEPPRMRLVADAPNLLVLIRECRRKDDFRRRAPPGGKRLLDRIATKNPLPARHQFAGSLMMPVPVVHYLDETPIR